jgi:hypothetical protein
VPDLLDCQADDKSTLIADVVAAIEHPPHDCLGVCGCGVGSSSRESLAKSRLTCSRASQTRSILHCSGSEETSEITLLLLDALDLQSTSGS